MSPHRRKVLLICDDDSDIRSLIAAMARGRYETLQAEDGDAALALIAKHPVDLMLLDVSMPGMDGMKTLKLARRLRPGLPITMLTAVTDVNQASRALTMGARAYVTKPIVGEKDEFWDIVDPSPSAPSDKPWRIEEKPKAALKSEKAAHSGSRGR